MIGQTISHYRIIEKLGEGGMGVVYKAEDSKLRRLVALKFPPVHNLAGPGGRARFVREAQAAAALNHPNICVVYEIDEADGHTFIAMEFVEGQSVKEKLQRRPFPAVEALDVAIQAAQGLLAAHGKGIVHRDIKSANLMVSSNGQVKVMDFGLAQVGERSQLTKTGVALGTAAYMSPEQAQAHGTDRRTDIWSLGVALYEMITGQLPFQGEVDAAVVYAVVNTQPEMPTALRSGLPVELDYLIEKALAKDREERYQRIDDVLVDLRALKKSIETGDAKVARGIRRRSWSIQRLLRPFRGPAAPERVEAPAAKPEAPRESVVVVLPLDNLSGDTEQDYFSDGMTDALITGLGKLKGLRVISRHSAMRYKGTQKPLREIAHELGVSYVVVGSVMQAEKHVRITAELIEAETDKQLWSDSFVRERRDILSLQAQVARTIAHQLRGRIGSQEQSSLASARPVDPMAYEAYLKGRYHLDRLVPDELDTSLKYFDLALKKDPDSAIAYTGIAGVWVCRNQMRVLPPEEARPKAIAAITKALELDSAFPEAQYMLAVIKTWMQWEWEAAETAFLRTLELNPNHGHARAFYGHYLNIMKRDQEAIEQSLEAIHLDPMNPLFRILYGVVLVNLRRYDDALEQFHDAEKFGANNFVMHDGLQCIYHGKGVFEDSYRQQRFWFSALGDEETVAALERGHALGGYRDALKQAADTLAARAATGFVGCETIFVLYSMAGEKDKTIEWLERGFQSYAPMMPYVSRLPVFDHVRDDPRFEDILRRMNLPL